MQPLRRQIDDHKSQIAIFGELSRRQLWPVARCCWTPRALAAPKAALVRVEIIRRSCSANAA
jgi:hypothetical protein